MIFISFSEDISSMLLVVLIFSNVWILIQNFGKVNKAPVQVHFNRSSPAMNLGKSPCSSSSSFSSFFIF